MDVISKFLKVIAVAGCLVISGCLTNEFELEVESQPQLLKGVAGSGGDGLDYIKGFSSLDGICLKAGSYYVKYKTEYLKNQNYLKQEVLTYTNSSCVGEIQGLRFVVSVTLQGEGALPGTTAIDIEYISMDLLVIATSAVDAYRNCGFTDVESGNWYPTYLTDCQKHTVPSNYNIFKLDESGFYMGNISNPDGLDGSTPEKRPNVLVHVLNQYQNP